MTLEELGWGPDVAADWADGDVPADTMPGRVVRRDHGHCLVGTAEGWAHPGVREAPEDPAVGDWVAIDGGDSQVVAVLPRRSMLARTREDGAEQLLAANVDWVCLTVRADRDFSPRRLERLLLIAWESGAQPLVALTKADLLPPDDRDARVLEVESIAFRVPVLPISVVTGEGIDALREYWLPGRTAVVIGESGAGKSSLVNALAGRDVQEIRDVRDHDRKGRHTTVARELFVVDGGRIVIDTPGIRAVGVTGGAGAVDATFPEIAALAAECRYGDCSHAHEPGCAVREAVTAGGLAASRLEGFHRLARELEHERRTRKPAGRQKERERGLLGKEAARLKRESLGRRPSDGGR